MKKQKPECIKDINVLYSTRINEQLSVYIGQKVIHRHEDWFERSQYAAIIIHDEKNDQHVRLRMSSLRKIFKFVKKKGWLKSRRFGILEVLKLGKREEDVREDMVPKHKEDALKKRKEQKRVARIDKVRKQMHFNMELLHNNDYTDVEAEPLRIKIWEAEEELKKLES